MKRPSTGRVSGFLSGAFCILRFKRSFVPSLPGQSAWTGALSMSPQPWRSRTGEAVSHAGRDGGLCPGPTAVWLAEQDCHELHTPVETKFSVRKGQYSVSNDGHSVGRALGPSLNLPLLEALRTKTWDRVPFPISSGCLDKTSMWIRAKCSPVYFD